MNERQNLARVLGTLVLVVVTLTARPSAGAYDRMIVFGDSLSDSGN